jgi:hypothetical protein
MDSSSREDISFYSVTVNVDTKIAWKIDYRMCTCHKTKEVTKFNTTGPLFTCGSLVGVGEEYACELR